MLKLSLSIFLLGLFATATEDLVTAMIVLLGIIPYVIIQFSPSLVLSLLYGDVSASLYAWCRSLENQAKSSQHNVKNMDTVLKQCTKFISAVRICSDYFSTVLLLKSAYYLIALVIGSYRFIAFFIGDSCEEYDWKVWAEMAGYGGVCLALGLFMFFQGHISDSVKRSVEDLTQAIIPMDITTMIACNVCNGLDHGSGTGSGMSLKMTKKLVLHQLKTFRGFRAAGYFELNRPSLMALMSSYVTYLIILMQFRVNEKVNC